MADAVLEGRGLRKSYATEAGPVEALRGVDVDLRAGELAVVLGPSGSGKSTLLNLLGLMDSPTEGEIRILGRPTLDLGEEGQARLRNRSIGFVFQFDSLLAEFTALENVLLPARISPAGSNGSVAAERRGRELLAELGLESLAGRFPNQLSGGERQRVAIARALVNQPALLLADEPTGNLDRPRGELVFKDLRRMAARHGVGVLLVTHNEGACRHADRVLTMSDGRVLEDIH